MDILNKTLNSIDDIINNTTAQNLDFYSAVLGMMSSLYNNTSISIFFFENNGCTLKKGIKDGGFITDYFVNKELAEIFQCSKDSIRMRLSRVRRRALALMKGDGENDET